MEKKKIDIGEPEFNQLVKVAFETIINNTKDMMFIKDVNHTYIAASLPFARMVGKECVEDIIGHTDLEIFEDTNLAKRYVSDDKKLMAKGENLTDYIEPITDEDGHARYGTTSKYLLFGDDGEIIGILGVTKDITKDYIARQHYQKELSYLFELPEDTLAVSYIDIDSWRIISQRRQNITEGTLQACQTVEELCEAALESIIDTDSDVAHYYRDFTPEALKEFYESGRNYVSFKYRRKLTNGMVRWVHNEVRFLVDVDSGHLCAMLSAKDIDEEKKAEEKLFVAAQMDRMTMLLNRETTMERIRQALGEEQDGIHVLFMIDVDNFKALNDTMGHQAGDEFLIEFAKELKESFRETDIVGRVGGDEFFAFMKNISGVYKAKKKADELLATIQKVCSNYSDVQLSGSIGIALYPKNGKSLADLYAMADEALYQAKRAGKNQYVFV